jgi:hypothetical protein
VQNRRHQLPAARLLGPNGARDTQRAARNGLGEPTSLLLVELKLIKKLLDAGVSLQRVREAIDYLRTLGSDLSGVTLVSDGASIFACHSDHEVVDVLRRGQGVFGIAIDPVIDGLRGSVSELRPAERAETEVPEGDAGEPPPRLKVAPSGGAPQGAG